MEVGSEKRALRDTTDMRKINKQHLGLILIFLI